MTVTVAEDTASAKQAITDFVTQYNNLIDFIDQQFKYDTTANSGGTLFADPSLQTIESDIVDKVLNPVSGLSQTAVVLSQIGIAATTSDNKLTVDDAKLDESLAAGMAWGKPPARTLPTWPRPTGPSRPARAATPSRLRPWQLRRE
jgi:flagellar hook-associated protein 2